MFNVIIAGTPGTGKSTLVEKIQNDLKEFNFVNLSKFAIDNDCILEYDDELGSHVIDEDKLSDLLESHLKLKQKNVIESIHADILPKKLVNVIFVCRTDNTILYDRLKERKYGEEKISNNIQAEIFQTILDEARELCENDSNPSSMIAELVNNYPDDIDRNANVIVDKIKGKLKDGAGQ